MNPDGGPQRRTDPSEAAAGPRGSTGPRRAILVALLAALSWALGGYQFGIWPQTFPLELIRALAGELRGDWYTQHAPPHWAFDHALALVPDAARPAAFAVLWLVGLATFWWAFVKVAEQLGADEPATLAAGWAGAWSGFAGPGTVTLLTQFLYPSTLACAAWAWALCDAFRGRARRAGLWLGLALLLHPQVGVLAVVMVGAALLRTARVRAVLEGAVVALLVGGVAVFRLVRDLGTHEPIAPAERFALLAEVRLPHHLLWARFPAWEYAMTALWLAVLLAAWTRLRGRRVMRGWGAALLASAALCLAGAFASVRGGPLALVELQTARLGAWLPFLALAAAAAALSRTPGPWGAALAFIVVPLAGVLGGPWRSLCAALGVPGMPHHALAAPLMLAAIVTGQLIERRDSRSALAPGVRLAAAAVAIAVALRAGGWRHPPRVTLEPRWVDIATRAGAVSQPTDVFLTPPELEGFRYHSRRPIVVDFGNVAHDDLRGWKERLLAVTRDSSALAPLPPITTAERNRQIAAEYEANVWRDRAVVDRYGVRFVVVRAGGPPPPAWAEPVAANDRYAIYRVRPPEAPAGRGADRGAPRRRAPI